MKSYTIYKCEICGTESIHKKDIEYCESKGTPKQLVKVGDRIKFKDCKESSIAKKYLDEYIPYYDSKEIYDFYRRCYISGEILKEYEVVKIEDLGHRLIYYLGENGASTWMFTSDFVNYNTYPTIDDNNLMQKILDLYN